MPRYTEEELRSVVSGCLTYTAVLKELGLRPAGGNFKTIQKWIKKWEIDTSHFESHSDRARRLLVKEPIPLEDALTENSTYNRGHLKRRLLNAGLLEKVCALCGQGENWNGNKLVHNLDHINGIAIDNRLENLRMICPNCDSTLDTYCGRNINIKKPRARGPRPHTRKVQRPPRKEVEAYTKKHGFLAAGRKYGVSDNAIRKWLKCEWD